MQSTSLYRATTVLLFFYLLITCLFYAQNFLVPFCVSILLAFLLHPISDKLEQWRVPKIAAIIISIVVAFIILGGLLFFFYSQIVSFKDDLPMLQEKLGEKVSNLQSFIERKTNITEEKQMQMAKERMGSSVAAGGEFLMGLFSATGTFLAMAALVPIYIFFMTYYKEKFAVFILRVTKSDHHQRIQLVIQKISKVTQKYLTGLLIDIAILSVLNSIGFLALGIEHAILLGVLASVLNIIPYIGVIIGSLLPMAMALLTKDSAIYALGVLGVCFTVQFIDNNFITPKVVGSSVNLNPLATLVALLIGGFIWGVAGMMLFIPLLGIFKVVLDNVESLRPYAYLIGEDADIKKIKETRN